ncbi:MAG TPA: hypothetical protein VHE12_11295 [bacterium]|nr:hypothetical protein [bacterium]
MKPVLLRPWGLLFLLAAPCLGAGTPLVIKSKVVPTSYHHEYSTAQIESMSSIKAPSRAAHEPGLTLFEYELSFNYDLNLRSERPGGPYRFWVKTLNLEFNVNRMEVFVSSQYPVGSCQYRAILDHENTHVAINTRTFKKYLALLKKELSRTALPTSRRTWTAADQARAQAAVDARIKPILDRIQKEFAAEDRRENAKIDTPASYRRTSAKCGDW